MTPQPHCQGEDIDEAVELKGPNEKQPKVLEHLGEKVPEESDIRRQLRNT